MSSTRDSDTDSNTDTIEMSDDTTQCLIDSLAAQIVDLQQERETLREANDILSKKMKMFEYIIKSDVLDKIFKYL